MNDINLEAISSNVYVFNCYNEPINALSVQFGTPVTIAGYGSSPTKYTPAGTAGPRAKGLAAGVFGVGANNLTAAWDSGTGTCTVVIPSPPNFSVDDDLILFIMLNKAVLADTRGHVLGTFDVSFAMMSETANAQ